MRRYATLTLHLNRTMPNKSRGCVKSADPNFGNDQIFDMPNFDESGRWIGWSKIEFSHRLSLQLTRGDALSSASRFKAFGPAWLSWLGRRSRTITI
jgi:hypothetical protein